MQTNKKIFFPKGLNKILNKNINESNKILGDDEFNYDLGLRYYQTGNSKNRGTNN